MFLESKTKFNIKNHKVSQFTEDDFFRWTNGNMYRTSYNDMRQQQPVANKNHALPGYQGFVPSLKADSLLQKRYTEQTRDVLHKRTISDKLQTISSTGWNKSRIPVADDTLHATSRRYGTETMLDTHPNIKPKDYKETTFRASFHNPKSIPRENWRSRDPSKEFDQ